MASWPTLMYLPRVQAMTQFKEWSLQPRVDTIKGKSKERWWIMLVWDEYMKERRKPSQNTTRIQGQQGKPHGLGVARPCL